MGTNEKIKETGITLVALVVTIIILLILAGVTVGTILGNNGLFKKTKQAVKIYEEKSKEEENKLIELEKMLENLDTGKYTITYYLNRGTDEEPTTQTMDNEESAKILGKEITREGYSLKGWATSQENANKGEIAYTVGDDYEEGVDISLYGVWAIDKLLADSHYGQFVDYGIDIDGDESNYDWQIFYYGKPEDGIGNGRIFLIAKDWVKLSSKCMQEVMNNTNSYLADHPTGTDDYVLSFASIPNELQEMKHNDLFMATLYNIEEKGINQDRSKCVSSMLNTDNWKPFVNEKFGEYAIGGSTIEMWIASWNGHTNKEKYPMLYISGKGNLGYTIGTTPEPNTSIINLSGYQGTNDKLYFPRHGTLSNYATWGTLYRLASPIQVDVIEAYGGTGVACCAMNNQIGHDGGNENQDATWRPVVVLKKESGIISGLGTEENPYILSYKK